MKATQNNSLINSVTTPIAWFSWNCMGPTRTSSPTSARGSSRDWWRSACRACTTFFVRILMRMRLQNYMIGASLMWVSVTGEFQFMWTAHWRKYLFCFGQAVLTLCLIVHIWCNPSILQNSNLTGIMQKHKQISSAFILSNDNLPTYLPSHSLLCKFTLFPSKIVLYFTSLLTQSKWLRTERGKCFNGNNDGLDSSEVRMQSLFAVLQ